MKFGASFSFEYKEKAVFFLCVIPTCWREMGEFYECAICGEALISTKHFDNTRVICCQIITATKQDQHKESTDTLTKVLHPGQDDPTIGPQCYAGVFHYKKNNLLPNDVFSQLYHLSQLQLVLLPLQA